MRMSLKVAMREGEDSVNEAKMAEYVSELRRYPADIALQVIGCWHERSKFWPAWKELKDLLDALFEPRRSILPALQALKPKEPEIPKTESDREAVRRMCDETVAKLKIAPTIVGTRFVRDDRSTPDEKRRRALDALERASLPNIRKTATNFDH